MAKKFKNRLSESASMFNDALLDEQANKIKEQEDEIKKLEDLKKYHMSIIASCREVICDQSKKIDKLGKKVNRMKCIIRGQNDLLEKHRISEISKDVMIGCLRRKVADVEVAKVNIQALKSAENALIEKDAEIEELKKNLKAIRRIVRDARIDVCGNALLRFMEAYGSKN